MHTFEAGRPLQLYSDKIYPLFSFKLYLASFTYQAGASHYPCGAMSLVPLLMWSVLTFCCWQLWHLILWKEAFQAIPITESRNSGQKIPVKFLFHSWPFMFSYEEFLVNSPTKWSLLNLMIPSNRMNMQGEMFKFKGIVSLLSKVLCTCRNDKVRLNWIIEHNRTLTKNVSNRTQSNFDWVRLGSVVEFGILLISSLFALPRNWLFMFR